MPNPEKFEEDKETEIEKGENDPPEEKTVKHFIPSATYQKMFGATPAGSDVVKVQGPNGVIHEYYSGGKGIWTDAL